MLTDLSIATTQVLHVAPTTKGKKKHFSPGKIVVLRSERDKRRSNDRRLASPPEIRRRNHNSESHK